MWAYRDPKGMLILAVGLGVLWVGVLAPQARGQSGPAYEYYYFDESRPLTLDVTRIAVRHADGVRSPEVLAALESHGISEEDLSAEPAAGWSLVDVPLAARTGWGVTDLVDQLAVAEAADFVSPVFVGLDGGPVYVTPFILVRFQAHVPPEVAEERLAASSPGANLDRQWGGMSGAYRVGSNSLNGLEVLQAANELARDAEVIFAEPDMMFTGRGHFIPNDTFFGSLWGIHNTGQSGGTVDMDMDGPEAWDITQGDASIITVVIDTGVQQDHPDINQVPGADFTGAASGGGPDNVCDNHGTAVAGCVTAIIDNNLGVVGMAPLSKTASARTFVSSLVCDGSWSSTASWTVNALAWAEGIGARVSNNSNFYGFASGAIASKYDDTRTNGMVHFASAGNDSSTAITYPSSLSSVNAVAALNRNGNLAFFSNSGGGLAFSAPGEAIVTTDRTGGSGWVAGDYVNVNGTSFASPYTAGVASLVLSVDSSLSAAEVEGIIQQTSVDLGACGFDLTFGWGFVNALGAVEAAGPQGPLTISLPNREPPNLPPLTPVNFDVQILADAETLVPGSATLHFRYDGGVFQTVGLDALGGDLFEASLPPAACGDTPEFYVSALGDLGSVVTLPENAPAQVLTAVVGEPTSIVLQEGFAADAGSFSYQDGRFRGTEDPDSAVDGFFDAAGGLVGGGLHVTFGPDGVEMSGGFATNFEITSGPGAVQIELSYRLFMAGTYEFCEIVEALLSVDGNLVGVEPNDYLLQFEGDGNVPATDLDSGWVLGSFVVQGLAAGTHQLAIGGYNNSSTFANELADVFFDDITVTQIECAPPAEIVSVTSVQNHDSGDLGLDLLISPVEPRIDGVERIDVGLTETVASVSASVSCVNQTYTGSLVATPGVDEVTLTFTPRLANEDCCEVTLSGDVEGSFIVQPLRGDLDRDGAMNTGDASQLRFFFNRPAVQNPDPNTESPPQWDYDQIQGVTTGDFSQIRFFFNTTVPACP